MELDRLTASIGYWSCAAVIAFAYLGYPAIVGLLARLFPRPVRPASHREQTIPGEPGLPSVSVVLAVYNERTSIARRVREFTDWIAAAGVAGEVVVVSDGSTDGSAEAVRRLTDVGAVIPVRLIDLTANVGKAAALTAGCRTARHDVIVLADARQFWAPDALARLLENFADPAVGAVSGELVVESAPGVIGGVGLYWRYEKWLRRQESRVHSTVGVTGAISAVRRELFRPIPSGTLLDDVYWPLGVAMQGYRVVFDARARAFDRLPEVVSAEFRRKVRTLSGNFQLVVRMPAALLPWRNPVWFPLVSHKLLRLAVPWAWGAALVLAALLGGPLYGALFAAQAAVTLVGVVGLHPRVAARSRLVAAGGSFLVLNAAAWYAFWVWLAGRSALSWRKTHYARPPALDEVAEPALAGAGR